ncbi:MAG: ROK family transcriptional regulator [Calditrichaeota bacterium]|nr:ROK family transcriptional regulator [Calditrichota bacterium]
MFQSGNHKFIKNLNRKHILNLVRMHQGITAREISELTNLKVATVLYTLKALNKQGQIIKAGMGDSSLLGGKPPVIWDINCDHGFVIGVEWLSTELRMVLLNFNAQPVSRLKTAFPNKLSDAEKIDYFVSTLKEFIKSSSPPDANLLGMGIGISGLVDFKQGIVRLSSAFRAQDYPLAQILKEHFNFPVFIENESNAGALGIKWLLPEFYQTSHIIYLSIQQCFRGMGIGFIINHQLYRGASNAVGEMPLLFTDSFFRKTVKKIRKKFGNNQTLIYREDGQDTISNFLRNALLSAQKNEASALFLWKEIAREIGKRLVLLIDLFNPQAVILGGDISEAKPFIESVLRQYIRNKPLSAEAKKTRLFFPEFGAFTNAMGAAAIVLEKIYTE